MVLGPKKDPWKYDMVFRFQFCVLLGYVNRKQQAMPGEEWASRSMVWTKKGKGRVLVCKQLSSG